MGPFLMFGTYTSMFECLQTRNCRKQGSSNKEVQKKIDRKNIHFDKTGPAATFDWDAKNSIRYITFEKLPQYMRSDDSDGISIYGQQPNEVSLSEEGRVQKLCRSLKESM